MTLREIADALNLTPRTATVGWETAVTGAYASDLLSDVMANSKAGELWITLQAHPNIVAVASLRDLAGIVLVGRREPQEETLDKANQEGVSLFVSPLPTFELAGRLYAMGVGQKSPVTGDR